MRHWTFWEWVAYAALFIASLIIAAETGFKTEPEVMERLPAFVHSGWWGFSPLAFVLFATIILVTRALFFSMPSGPDLRAQVRPEPATPNYQAWRHVEKFSVFQAAYLWVGREPRGGSLHPDALAWEEALCAAIRTGQMGFIPRRLKPGPYSLDDVTSAQIARDKQRQQSNPDSSTEVSREQLKAFAKANNEKPKFLED